MSDREKGGQTPSRVGMVFSLYLLDTGDSISEFEPCSLAQLSTNGAAAAVADICWVEVSVTGADSDTAAGLQCSCCINPLLICHVYMV